MKLKNYTVLSVFVLSATFLFFRLGANGQTECQERQTIEKIKELIIVGPTVENPEVIRQKYAEKIRENYLRLCNLFKAGDYDGMADLLGKKASLKIADGQYIRGKGSIRDYFEEKKDGGYQRVEFELVWAVIVYDEKKPIFARDTNNTAFENFKYHLIKQSEGMILQNQDGEGERSGRHTHGCDWIGN
jgi:hypothetical protein